MTTSDVAAGQVLIGGTYGVELSRATASRVEAGHLGGLILMGRNIESPAQVRTMLSHATRAAAGGLPPPLLGVDQEGGRVARLKAPILQLPPARTLGSRDDEQLTRRAYQTLGRQLAALGFTVDFAPVLDVDDGPEREVIGDRSFSGEPDVASRHGAAAVAGLLAAGLCPCGKHFPGHGVTACDSHASLPVVDKSLAELGARELRPFAAAIASGLPMVMPAHVVYRGVDAEHPATFSRALLVDVLRKELGFEGVVITDDLKMGAVVDAGGAVDVAREAMMAGADLLLCCHDESLQEAIREALADEARRSDAFAKRLEDAAERSVALRRRFVPGPVRPEELDEQLSSEEISELELALDGDLGKRRHG